MLIKIYEINDLFYYVSKFLDLQSKIILEKIFNKKMIKSFDFFSKKYKKCNFHYINCICSKCYCNLVFDQSLILDSKYNNFLHYDEDDIKDNDNNSDDDSHIYKPYHFFYKDQINFLTDTYSYVSIRSFLEIIDKHEISIDLFKTSCIFELNFDSNIYDEIYNNIDNYYDNAIINHKLNNICKRCGLFGHNDETKECILYNEKYQDFIIKKKTKKILNNMLDILVINDEREKKYKLNKKSYCIECDKLFSNKKCEFKKCKICCNCKNHKKNKLYNKYDFT